MAYSKSTKEITHLLSYTKIQNDNLTLMLAHLAGTELKNILLLEKIKLIYSFFRE